MSGDRVVLRQGRPADAAALAELHRTVRAATMPYLPDLHTTAEDLWFFENRVLVECTVQVAAGEDSLLGFGAYRPGWLDHLYVDPARHGQGLGTALLGIAQAENDTLKLWVFQRNQRAIDFYRRRGFVELERADGVGNEEKEPDMLMEWRRPVA